MCRVSCSMYSSTPSCCPTCSNSKAAAPTFVRARSEGTADARGASGRTPQQRQADALDGVRGAQALRADLGAVHDRAAAVEAIDVVEKVQALGGGGVAAVGDEAVGLQQPRRADELVRIPPVGRAERAAAGAQ